MSSARARLMSYTIYPSLVSNDRNMARITEIVNLYQRLFARLPRPVPKPLEIKLPDVPVRLYRFVREVNKPGVLLLRVRGHHAVEWINDGKTVAKRDDLKRWSRGEEAVPLVKR